MRPVPVAVAFLLVLVLIAAPAELGASEHSAGARIFVHVLDSSASSPAVRRVVLSTVVLHLEQQGIVVTGSRADAGPTRPALADTGGAHLVIAGIIRAAGDRLSIRLELILADSGQVVGTAESIEEIGLTLDRAVVALTAGLLDRASVWIAAASEAAAAASEAAASETAAATAVAAAPGQTAAAAGAQQTPAGPGAAEPPSAPGMPRPLAPAPEARPDHAVSVSAGVAPYLPVAAGTAYLDAALGGSLAVTLLPGPRDLLAAGLFGRAYYGTATGASAEADLLLVPFGALVRILSPGVSITPHIGVGLGAAVVSARNPILGSYTKVIAYGAAELGIQIELFRGAGLELGVGFEAYLEGSILLIGFSPAAGAFVRF